MKELSSTDMRCLASVVFAAGIAYAAAVVIPACFAERKTAPGGDIFRKCFDKD